MDNCQLVSQQYLDSNASVPTPPLPARPKALAQATVSSGVTPATNVSSGVAPATNQVPNPVTGKIGDDANQTITTPIRFGPSMNISNVTQQIVVGDDLTAVKISEVALQGVETKVSLIEIKFMRAGRQNYRNREGADPEKEEAPTREQASAFIAIITMKESIYIYIYGFRFVRSARGQAHQEAPL